MLFRPFSFRFGVFVFVALATASQVFAAPRWKVEYLNSVTLDTASAGITVNELGGVSLLEYLPGNDKYRFIAALEDAGELVVFDVKFATDGSLVSAEADRAETINSTLDYEGIVTVPGTNRVFLSEENTPGVREFDLTTGNEVQSVAIPTVFDNARSNRGFESLARNAAGTTMWTANEEALTVDGAISSTAASTTVRLQQFDVTGSTVTASSQYAYEVDPIHTGGFSVQRGLSELVVLPDGTLLGLERSFASGATPAFESEIFEIDLAGATDVSQAPFDTGLSGQSVTPVDKYLLWSGQAGAASGENLEGLTLVTRDDESMILLGVTDNQGSLANTIVAFELSLNITGDFDNDGDADGTDFLTWQRNVGTGTSLEEGDATADGNVDAADLAIWQGEYGTLSVASQASLQSIPEPTTWTLMLLAGASVVALSRRR